MAKMSLNEVYNRVKNGKLDVRCMQPANGDYCKVRSADFQRMQATLGQPLDQSAAGGHPPLHLAAMSGTADRVSELLAAGAKVEAVDKTGLTALHWCALRGHLDCLQALLEAGANIDAVDRHDTTPLHVAARGGQLASAQALLAAGANVQAVDALNAGPLHWAADGGQVACIELLIDAQASIDAADAFGWTALHRAALEGQLSAIECLVEAGADVFGGGVAVLTPSAAALAAKQNAAAQLLKGLERRQQAKQRLAASRRNRPEAGGAASAPAPTAAAEAAATAAAAELMAEEEREQQQQTSKQAAKAAKRQRQKERQRQQAALVAGTDVEHGTGAALGRAAVPAPPSTMQPSAAAVPPPKPSTLSTAAGPTSGCMAHSSSGKVTMKGNRQGGQEVAAQQGAQLKVPGSRGAGSAAVWEQLQPHNASAPTAAASHNSEDSGGDELAELLRLLGVQDAVQDSSLGSQPVFDSHPNPHSAPDSTLSGLLSDLLCPITQQPMRDPVVAADGRTYERVAIEGWFAHQAAAGQAPCSPLTNLPLADMSLRPNATVGSMVQAWQAAGLLW